MEPPLQVLRCRSKNEYQQPARATARGQHALMLILVDGAVEERDRARRALGAMNPLGSDVLFGLRCGSDYS
jgi:flagellin-specific chaperone FliS